MVGVSEKGLRRGQAAAILTGRVSSELVQLCFTFSRRFRCSSEGLNTRGALHVRPSLLEEQDSMDGWLLALPWSAWINQSSVVSRG